MQISLTLGLAAFAERIQRRRLGPSDFSKSFAGTKEEGKCSLTSGSAFVADRHFLEAAALYKENGADDLAPFVVRPADWRDHYFMWMVFPSGSSVPVTRTCLPSYSFSPSWRSMSYVLPLAS